MKCPPLARSQVQGESSTPVPWKAVLDHCVSMLRGKQSPNVKVDRATVMSIEVETAAFFSPRAGTSTSSSAVTGVVCLVAMGGRAGGAAGGGRQVRASGHYQQSPSDDVT